ncbi:695_t:CDS:10, partial [Dentiscutata erythropus]
MASNNNNHRQDNNKRSNKKKNFSNDKLNDGNNDLNAITSHGPSNFYSNNEDTFHYIESTAITSVHDESNKRSNRRRSNEMNDDRNRTAFAPHGPSQSYPNTSNNEGNSHLNEDLSVTTARDEFKRPNRKNKNKLNDNRINELNDGRERVDNTSNNRDDSSVAVYVESNNKRSNKIDDHIVTATHNSNYLNKEDDFQYSESSTTTIRGKSQRQNRRKKDKLNDSGNNKLDDDRESVSITSPGPSETYPSALNNEDVPQSKNTPVRNEFNNKRSDKRKKLPNDGSNNLNEDRDNTAIVSSESSNTYSDTLNYENDSHSTENSGFTAVNNEFSSKSPDKNFSSLERDNLLNKTNQVDLSDYSSNSQNFENNFHTENVKSGQKDYGQGSHKARSLRKNVALTDANFKENIDSIDKAKSAKQKKQKQVKHDVTKNSESQESFSYKSASLQSGQSVRQEILNLDIENKDLKHDNSVQKNSDQAGQSTSGTVGITDMVGKLIEKVLPKVNNDDIVIVFYVHMPRINEIGFPFVVGNIPELGDWDKDKTTIKLTEKKINGKPTSCWESKPVRIPLAQFEKKVTIEYKYAIKEKGKKSKSKPLILEGGKNRVLEVDGGDKYEIWEENGSKITFPSEFRDVYLVKIIYDSVTSENLKEKIMKYEKILERYPKSTKAATSIEFIMNSFLEDKSLEKRLFLCVLLGYYVKGRDSQYSSLPPKFQSSLVFETIQNINAETFQSGTYKILALTIPLLVRHNYLSLSETHDWLKVFGVANFIDPKYEFLNYLTDFNYGEKTMNNFFKSFNEFVTPIIRTIDDKELYAKIVEFLVTVWQEIVNHDDEIDELLRPNLIERARSILSRTVLCNNLYICYSDLPEQLKIMFTEIFRKQSLRLLSTRQNQQWDKNQLDAITNLLTNDQIQWSLEEYFNVLDIVSQSVDLGILTRFHELLKFGFKTFNIIDEQEQKLSLLCKQWYRHLLDRASSCSSSNTDLRNKFAFMAFNHISKVYPYIGKIPIWEVLLEIVVNRVRLTSENIILGAVNKVAQRLEPPVIEAFIAMVKDRLTVSILCADNQLMTKIKLICDCTTDELEIPTSEDVLYYIMTRLQNSCDSQTFTENFHLSLLKSGDFWIQLLKATGSVDKLHSHPQIKEVRNAISHLAEILIEESISIDLLQELLKKDDDFLLTYFGFAIMKDDLPSINKDILTNIRKKNQIYGLGLDYLNSFYTEFCPQSIAFDVKEYTDDIYEMHQRKKVITLRDTSLTYYWGMHIDVLGIAEELYKYRKSQTFKNFLNLILNDTFEGDVQEVKWLASTMPDIYKDYCQWCSSYSKWETQRFSHAKVLWDKVPDVTSELDLMGDLLKVEKSPKLIRTLTDISKVTQWIDKLQQLSVVESIFRIQMDEDEDDWLLDTLDDLKDDETLTLGILSDSFDLLHERLQMIDNACWALIKELSLSGDFLNWIRSIADHDIKNLINGVDDHSDERLIQEDTVSSLIQVKQFLLPIMIEAESCSREKFLKEIRNVTETNFSLASKITLCNCNSMALQNMYAAISNRGEVTKEKIYIGVYEFKWTSKDDTCSTTLSYSSKNGVKMIYSMNDLQDLRGRALLIAKPASTIYTEDEEESKDIMNEFVLQVDKAQNIIDESTKLIEAGHFNYRDYKKEVKGLEQLNTHLKNLEKDLKACTVSKVQQEHYYLTFFPARHILSFYDYFSNSKGPNRRSCERTCETLVRYVNFEAKLPSMRNPKDALSVKNNHYRILCEIGARLMSIFEFLPKDPIPFEECGERVVSDVVYPGKLFVAACSDRSVITNIIMSLYANSKFYPNAWQLLICTSSTTSEEIAIFIKRCSFASNNGYNDYLFCMANLEVLDYKLQYYVVKQIRNLLDKAKNFYLALICCQESGMHHHILDQFSEYVRKTDGLSAKSMKESYRAICRKVVCVTSDLSGQGKTEWIKQESYRKKFIPRTFIVNDGADFGKLVRQFMKFPIRKELDSLHINIISADNPWEVNMFLFHLLTFGIVSHQSDIATLPDIYIYIEVASSVDNRLAKSLPIVSYLDTPHLRFNLKKLIVSNEICSPVQVVCHYLNAYENASLDEYEISYLPPKLKSLPSKRCQQLLSKYFFETITPDLTSYRFLEIFINVFANQLNLRLMIKENNIRLTLFNTLMDVSKDFATRSIQTKSSQKQALSDSPDQLENITSWDDSNHLLVFFMSQTPDSICALYRDRAKVPENVQTLLKSQHISRDKWQLEDYRTMHMELLLHRLEGLARKTQHQINYPPYALSADNLLKMALILLRTRANVPVVICGEAGCGKTSLISFLARVVEAEFHALNLHAGITEEIINQFMEDSQKNVDQHEVWLFFDEINTCNHIGLLSDLIAHRVYKGNQMVHPNIKIFAACNPYRIRTKSSSVAGLQIKRFDEQRSNLVYEVKPLPDQILDYVWDYGVLEPSDERKYIEIMTKTQLYENNLYHDILPDLLFTSQQFIRNIEEKYTVSLRDVKRAITLIKFFHDSLQDRPRVRKNVSYPPVNARPNMIFRSYILGLGLCYQSRLYEKEQRTAYRKEMCKIFLKNKIQIREELFEEVIRKEQEDYVDRMTLPFNTAKNDALLENVLVMIVCILTKIPVFIIGAPGSSKSLAIRLVSQNLRGSDSNDAYFKKLPQAKKFQDTSSDDFPVVSVVLLDEVGLAETSPHNPLKVLHSLLEPSYPAEGPTVSVVGISNWRLDNSKSSRALLVQRPQLTLDDLVEIAVRLLNDESTTKKSALEPEEIEHCKKVYFKDQHHDHLEDYFSSLLATDETTKVSAMNDPGDHHFEKLLVYEISEQKLFELESTDINQLPEWQHEVNKIISLCTKLPEASDIESFHLLQICSDLISTESIPLDGIKKIIRAAYPEGAQEIFTSKFIKTVFQILEVKDYVPRKLFIIKCLDVLPLISNIRLDLYKNLFSKDPFPLMSIIIYKIFQQEDEKNKDIFFQLLKMPKNARIISPRLNAINNCLSNHGLGSFMATLCCDVLQKSIFSNCTLEYSAEYFQDAIKALLRPESDLATLHRIASIAFLKEFVHQFWDCTNSDNKVSDPIEINNLEVGDIEISELTHRLNYIMEVNKQVPLIHSLRIYFLRALRRCHEFSLDDVKRFCKAQEYTFPWLSSLSWEDDKKSNRFPFNPYRSIEDYNNLETTFAPLYNFNNKGPFEKNFFNKFKKKNSNLSHLALMGLIFSRLHAIRASRQWTENEISTALILQEKIDSVDHLSTIYKTTIKSIISNEHILLGLNGAINNQDLLIKSVIGHTIALHASIRHDSSPLAHLLQNLHYCTGLFIPATPSDETSIVLSAVLQRESLTPDLEKEISDALDFNITDDTDSEENSLQLMDDGNVIAEENEKKVKKIPAEVFAGTIKRFILRFLMKNLIKEDHPMSIYFTDDSLNLWPAQISEELIDELFPTSLMVCHAFEAYRFVSEKIEGVKQVLSQNQNTSKRFQRNRNPMQKDQNASHQNVGPENSSSNTSSNRGSYGSRGGRGFNKGRNNASRGQNQGNSNVSGGNDHSENAESSKRGRGNNRKKSRNQDFNKNNV